MSMLDLCLMHTETMPIIFVGRLIECKSSSLYICSFTIFLPENVCVGL